MKDVILKPGEEKTITVQYPQYSFKCSGTELYTRKHVGDNDFYFKNEDPEENLTISFTPSKT